MLLPQRINHLIRMMIIQHLFNQSAWQWGCHVHYSLVVMIISIPSICYLHRTIISTRSLILIEISEICLTAAAIYTIITIT